MAECAFCEHTGKLSAEHITSRWLNRLFTGPAKAWWGTSETDGKPFKAGALDFKTKVVCQTCNNTWMSDIERDAESVLTPLITGSHQVPITPQIARSMAVWAYKTAVIIDHTSRNRVPFFSRRFRHAFRKNRFIPAFVNMWMCPSLSRSLVRFRSVYNEGTTPAGNFLNMYTCTCTFGHFTCQVLSVIQSGQASFRSNTGRFEQVAVPFWPTFPRHYVWPHPRFLDADDFAEFTTRWNNITIFEM